MNVSAILILLLVIMLDMAYGILQRCTRNTTDVIEEDNSLACLVRNDDSVCLVCSVPILLFKDGVWSRDNDSIFIRDRKTDYSDNISKDVCHDIFTSIYIPSISFGNVNETYQCSKRGVVHVNFILRVTADPTLNILYKSAELFSKEILLECIVGNALQPLTITWMLNNNITSSETIYKLSNQTVSSTRTFGLSEKADVVTCKVSGLYITEVNVTFTLSAKQDIQDSPNSAITINAAIVAIVTCLVISTGLGIIWFLRTHLSICGMCVPNTNAASRTIRDKEPVVIYTSPSRNNINDTGMLQKDETLKFASRVSKGTCIKVGKRFEYWKCSFTNSLKEEKNSLVKTLTANRTITEATEFRELVLRLKTLRKHAFIVELLSVSVDNVPSIAYIFMESGTLRDFMLTRYEESRKSQICVDDMVRLPTQVKCQVEELLSFSYDVACAMRFLASQKYCHPVLSSRKIILTQHCKCQLYDICPEDMAMSNINRHIEKEYPPIMWLSPESVFMKQYSIQSDVWNFGVFLWEIFSLGKVPYPGLKKNQLEEKIRQSIILTQPICCPGAIYSIMLSCWCNSKDARPTIEALHAIIKQLLDATNEENADKQVGATVVYDSLK